MCTWIIWVVKGQWYGSKPWNDWQWYYKQYVWLERWHAATCRICCLDINEMPFHRIVAQLDGPTSSDKGWRSRVGKLLSLVDTTERNTEFKLIPLLEPLVHINENIVSKMSTDSMVARKYLQAVVKGKINSEIVDLDCGKLCHSRWLTRGMRCLLLYMSKHNLGSKDTNILEMLATWVTQVYLPMFYEIKVTMKSSIAHGI